MDAMPCDSYVDFDDFIRAWFDTLGSDDFVVPVEAQKLVAHAQETCPMLLDRWLQDRAALFVASRVSVFVRSQRAQRLARHHQSVFASAAEQAAAGDDEALARFFDVPYVIDPEGHNRSLRRMTWSNLDYAAGGYEERSAANAFEAAFLRAVQKRLPSDDSATVEDRFSEEQLENLRRRLAA